jgi:carbon-monoxide dehydrogenase large subunit
MGNYIGQAMKRYEDPRFIQGKGKYVANLSLPNMAYLAIKRSPGGRSPTSARRITTCLPLKECVTSATG